MEPTTLHSIKRANQQIRAGLSRDLAGNLTVSCRPETPETGNLPVDRPEEDEMATPNANYHYGKARKYLRAAETATIDETMRLLSLAQAHMDIYQALTRETRTRYPGMITWNQNNSEPYNPPWEVTSTSTENKV